MQRTNAFFAKYGGLAVILARFVPVVRTFAPIAAGVGKMNYRRYSLYNIIGAFIWGAGITTIGYFLGNIRPVANFVIEYIDIVLVAIVVVTAVPALFHWWRSKVKAHKEAALAEGAPSATSTEHQTS